MSQHKYLTKSKFKKAIECPSKLYFTGKDEYDDSSTNNSFLEALAQGGYQVGELAKCYYPGGHQIDTLDYEDAIAQTNALLEQENVTIYEAAFLINNLFVRVDILVKQGDRIQLLEVKAKSFESEGDFTNYNRSQIKSGWKAYISDVAFQMHVVSNVRPDWNISPFLVLADKNVINEIDGFNQKFPISHIENGRIKVEHTPLENYGNKILKAVDVEFEVGLVFDDNYELNSCCLSFSEYVDALSDSLIDDQYLEAGVGSKCKKCEFVVKKESELLSGLNKCWKEQRDVDFETNNNLKVFDLTEGRTNNFIASGINFIKDIPEAEFAPFSHSFLDNQTRRYLQVVKAKEGDNSLHFEKERFEELKLSVNYPIHMIDFETSRVAIPFHAGMRSYEQIAFQFSHHIIYENGEIEHKSEWINNEKGKYPNFEFVRQLKNALDNDQGTIFRYSHHENSVLRDIHGDLYRSLEADKEELMTFIDSITHSDGRIGSRNMLDLCAWVKETYFDPLTKGSSSLKLILPSILYRSSLIQKKYSKPIYGKEIKSRSIGEMTIIQRDTNKEILNPYKLLPPIFKDNQEISWSKLEKVEEGGAAMTAYAKMQFEEIPEEEKRLIEKALLKYCELDTMAMVLLWEGLNDLANE